MDASRSFFQPYPLDYNGPVQVLFEPFSEQDLATGIFQLFERRAHQQPNQIAVMDGEQVTTYARLLQLTRQIATAIRQQQLPPQAPIGIWMEKSAAGIATILAILAEGHPYVAFDLSMPRARNEAILDHASVALVIGYQANLRELPPYLTQLSLEAIDSYPAQLAYNPVGSATDIAYILYTSGTTGQPKGVYQHQRGVLHDVMQYVHSIHLNANDRHSLLYSLSVIGAVRDVLGTLLTGGSLHLYHPARQGIDGLANYILEQQLTIYHSLPLLFRGFLHVARHTYFPQIRLVYLAGDRIYRADVDRYRASFPPTAYLYVGIGSTENATLYRQWFIDHQTELTDELIPVGYSVPDRFMQLIKESGEEAQPGETGEIVVTSEFMALGYWQNEALSRQAFQPCGKARRFRTGDLGRLLPNGLLSFIGRQDRQLKLSGYRVEPAEIEAILQRAPQVTHAAVLVRPYPQQPVLVAYIVEKERISVHDLRDFAARYLPAHMVPVEWEYIPELPVTANLKIDYNALQQIDSQRVNERLATAPTTTNHTEQALRNVWGRFTFAGSFDQDCSWRNSGGSSFNALLLLVELEELLQQTLPTDWFHVDMTPSVLLQKLLTLAGTSPLRSTQSDTTFVVFPSLNGVQEGSYHLIQELRKLGNVQVIRYPTIEGLPLKEESIQRLLDYIKPQFDSFPPLVNLIGICSGCSLAHETAHWLEVSKLNVVNHLIYLDHPPAKTELSWSTILDLGFPHMMLTKAGSRLLRAYAYAVYLSVWVWFQKRQKQPPIRLFIRFMMTRLNPSYVNRHLTLIQCTDTKAMYPLKEAWLNYVPSLMLHDFSVTHLQILREAEPLHKLMQLIRMTLQKQEKAREQPESQPPAAIATERYAHHGAEGR